MGFHTNEVQFNTWLIEQQKTYDIYAPKRYVGGNTFSDVDCIRYGKISSISEIVFDQKSEYSFKEVLTPISQTLFFFTEDQCKEADPPKKGAIIFLRSCDLHALKRLDNMYLNNGPADYYYERIRDHIKIILNTYDYVKEYIDPNAPGGKEHIGYIVDRTGFEEFKRWALKDVVLPEKAAVMSPVYWKGIQY